mgnify:CR=1 FL=1
MRPLRFAILGAGFWSRFQLAGWRELDGATCVAVYNRTRSKAEALAREFGVPTVYDDAGALFDRETLDFVDIITGGAARPACHLPKTHGPRPRCRRADGRRLSSRRRAFLDP